LSAQIVFARKDNHVDYSNILELQFDLDEARAPRHAEQDEDFEGALTAWRNLSEKE